MAVFLQENEHRCPHDRANLDVNYDGFVVETTSPNTRKDYWAWVLLTTRV